MTHESAAGVRVVPEWVAALARESNSDSDRRLGALTRIGVGSLMRAIDSVEKFQVVSLGRVLHDARTVRDDARSAFGLINFTSTHGRVVFGDDHLELDCHGLALTHIDGLNHFGVDGTWHGNVPIDEEGGPSIADWASTGLVTRGVFLDVAAVRSTDWVDAGSPVTGADLDAAVQLSGIELAEGDALLIYMGRDKYEAAGHKVEPLTTSNAIRPGIGEDGAQWIARQRVAAVAWDFLDAHHPDEPPHSVHFLIWAQGLALIDNCDLSRAREAVQSKNRSAGLLVVSPLRIPGGTGSVVNPLFVI